jgi:hypothetical protein
MPGISSSSAAAEAIYQGDLVGWPRGVPILEAPREGTVRLAVGEGRQSSADARAAGDAARGHRLADPAAHVAAAPRGIEDSQADQSAVDF